MYSPRDFGRGASAEKPDSVHRLIGGTGPPFHKSTKRIDKEFA